MLGEIKQGIEGQIPLVSSHMELNLSSEVERTDLWIAETLKGRGEEDEERLVNA